jgi:elongation factor 2
MCVLKYSVSPVVRVAVSPKNATDLPKFVEGLTKLSKSDPLLQVNKEETGQYIIAGCGELHVEIALHSLEKEYAKVPIVVSEPVVGYMETISKRFDQPILSKSTNKHNRLFCTAEPLDQELVDAIERGEIGPNNDPKQRSKILVEQFGWDKEDTLKLWCFGMDNTSANVLVDMTKGIQYMTEIRDSVQTAFQTVTTEGVLCGEGMRKLRFNIHDAVIHSDPAHRGGGQIIEMARRVFYACELNAEPRLQEPVFQAEITVPYDSTGGVYQCLNQRRGTIIDEEVVTGSPLALIRAYLPVSESFGFAEFLRSNTGGRAFPQCVFHHWDDYSGDPLDETTKAYEIVKAIRKRKGMKDELPNISMYVDKL